MFYFVFLIIAEELNHKLHYTHYLFKHILRYSNRSEVYVNANNGILKPCNIGNMFVYVCMNDEYDRFEGTFILHIGLKRVQLIAGSVGK